MRNVYQSHQARGDLDRRKDQRLTVWMVVYPKRKKRNRFGWEIMNMFETS